MTLLTDLETTVAPTTAPPAAPTPSTATRFPAPSPLVAAAPAERPAGVGYRVWLWRLLVLGYAVAVLAFLADIKSGVVSGLTSSLPLQIYGLLVIAYLGSRMALAARYRPCRAAVADTDLPVVAAVVPAFNEQDRIAATIHSLYALDYPADRLRVVVIDDGSTDATWDRIVEVAAQYPRLDALRFSRNRGKRAGMAAGIRAADGAELVLFVDSDSTLDPDALRELVRPFRADGGEQVGVVTGQADVLNASVNLLTRLQQVRYYAAFRVIKAAESVFGVVSCASGCFSAYRRTALLEVLSEWENQRFLKREATFGDDRALTNYLLRRKWRSVYQSTAVCGTAAPERWRGFLRQQLRWKKSWSRESLRVLTMAWRWHPVAAAAMYASILFQIVGPFVAFHALLWGPLVTGRNPLLYLVGMHAIAVLYGLFYAWSRRSPQWWGGILFAFVYSAVLCWQTYWAMLRSRDTGWGTRDSVYADDTELRIGETIGSPGACGIPFARDVVEVRPFATPRPGSVPVEAPAGPDRLSRRDWVIGLVAVPLTALPFVLWLLAA